MFRCIAVFGLLLVTVSAFDCPADTILRLATNHRTKDLEAECHRSKTENLCNTQKEADEAWDAFEKVQNDYKKAVAECVAIRKSSKLKRSVQGNTCQSAAEEAGRIMSSKNIPLLAISTAHHEDGSGDHSGHNHKRRHAAHRDAHDQHVQEHEHRHHKRNVDVIPFSEPERQQISRARRQVCLNKGKEALDKMQDTFTNHCDRENICLPDEDLPEGAKRDHIKELQKKRAKHYTDYLSHVSMCNA